MVFVDWPAFLIISLTATAYMLVSTLVQKHLTDQQKLREARERLKALQKEVRTLPPEEALKRQGEMMRLNTLFMREQMRVMPWTLLPALILFMLLAAAYSSQPIPQGEPVRLTLTLSQPVNVSLTGVNVTILNQSQEGETLQVTLMLTAKEGRLILTPPGNGGSELSLTAGSPRVRKEGVLVKRVKLPARMIIDDLPLPWPKRLTWLGVYILTALLASMLWRRVLGVV